MNDSSRAFQHAEILILPDGRILAHNITPEIAGILAELAPTDESINQRAAWSEQHEEAAAGN